MASSVALAWRSVSSDSHPRVGLGQRGQHNYACPRCSSLMQALNNCGRGRCHKSCAAMSTPRQSHWWLSRRLLPQRQARRCSPIRLPAAAKRAFSASDRIYAHFQGNDCGRGFRRAIPLVIMGPFHSAFTIKCKRRDVFTYPPTMLSTPHRIHVRACHAFPRASRGQSRIEGARARMGTPPGFRGSAGGQLV